MFEVFCFPWIPEFDGDDYAVVVGTFPTRAQAEAHQARMNATYNLDFFIGMEG